MSTPEGPPLASNTVPGRQATNHAAVEAAVARRRVHRTRRTARDAALHVRICPQPNLPSAQPTARSREGRQRSRSVRRALAGPAAAATLERSREGVG